MGGIILKLWAGRYSKDLAPSALALSQSLDADSVMLAQDIWGSLGHALMLGACGILRRDDLVPILTHLKRALEESEKGQFPLRRELEDVHMNVETYLIEAAGPEFGGKLHTARSRNDQGVTDTRMYLRERILDVQEALAPLENALLAIAEQHLTTVMPGYTHTQQAQPVSLAFWATGHASAFARDQRRLASAYQTVNQCPLGACAFAGTSFPTDRLLTAELLGFDGLVEHALDAVSTRDFALETVSAFAILATNLSKLAEEVVWWSTYEFGLVEVDDAYATGSSIMPQKKNPCVAELTRGKAGHFFGALVELLTTFKGLPMGYNRDFQEDKAALWSAVDEMLLVLPGMAETVGTLKFNTARMAEIADANFTAATELANYLVREHGFPFRRAHEVVGHVVGQLTREARRFSEVGRVAEILAQEGVQLTPETLGSLLDPNALLHSYRSLGSTSPGEVSRMIGELHKAGDAAAALRSQRREALARARRLTTLAAEKVVAGAEAAEAIQAARQAVAR